MQESQSQSNLVDSWHGKSRVRVAKVRREGTRHAFVELKVEILLRGGSARAFTHGDNSHVVATDTCKNHVYMLAKTHPCSSPESFALVLAERFLHTYSWLTQANVTVMEVPWRRAEVLGKNHQHAFSLTADGSRKATVQLIREKHGSPTVELVSGLNSLSVLKTTKSGWEGFVQDKYTTLPETNERILATTIDAQWTYRSNTISALHTMQFSRVHDGVRRALLESFYGPPDTGRYSPGVQKSLYEMAREVRKRVKEVDSVTLSLPNLHFLPCRIPVFLQNGIKFEDDVFIPTDEPHGIIEASVGSPRLSRL